MNEIWKDIPGYEGKYQISSYGRVKSLRKCWNMGKQKTCIEERIMLQYLNIGSHGSSYMVIWLRKPGSHKKFYIHKLLGLTFLENPEDKPMINHKDLDKLHNCVFGCSKCPSGNLEWSTYSENTQHWMRKKDDF